MTEEKIAEIARRISLDMPLLASSVDQRAKELTEATDRLQADTPPRERRVALTELGEQTQALLKLAGLKGNQRVNFMFTLLGNTDHLRGFVFSWKSPRIPEDQLGPICKLGAIFVQRPNWMLEFHQGQGIFLFSMNDRSGRNLPVPDSRQVSDERTLKCGLESMVRAMMVKTLEAPRYAEFHLQLLEELVVLANQQFSQLRLDL